jgi:hypothetical protein
VEVLIRADKESHSFERQHRANTCAFVIVCTLEPSAWRAGVWYGTVCTLCREVRLLRRVMILKVMKGKLTLSPLRWAFCKYVLGFFLDYYFVENVTYSALCCFFGRINLFLLNIFSKLKLAKMGKTNMFVMESLLFSNPSRNTTRYIQYYQTVNVIISGFYLYVF